jgi:hypothetical protein
MFPSTNPVKNQMLMDVIYEFMYIGVQALKMRVQASKMWILANKIVKSAELYIDTIRMKF